jgi:hypothetical protein
VGGVDEYIPSCTFKVIYAKETIIEWEGGRTCSSCSIIKEEKNNSICLCNYFIFWCYKLFKKIWWTTTTTFGGFRLVYLQGLHALVNLWECLALEVSFTPKPPCIISFSIFLCGRSVASHG